MTETLTFAPPVSALDWVLHGDTATTVEKGDRLEAFTAYVLIPNRYGVTNAKVLGHDADLIAKGQDRADVTFTLGADKFFIQCKNYVVPEGAVYHYVKAFEHRKAKGGYTKLMLVARDFTEGALQVMEHYDVIGFSADGMRDYDVTQAEFLAAWTAKTPLIKPGKSKLVDLRPHNADAINHLVALGYGSPRNIVARATGSGKTIVQSGTIAGLAPNKVLCLVPSIALTAQLAKSYLDDLSEFGYEFLIVASDEAEVDGETDEDIVRTKMSTFGVPTTTDPGKVAHALATTDKLIVISTYQSMRDVVGPAVATAGVTFDYSVFDEAHRTASVKRDEISMYAWALDDANVKIARRDFFTATPRFVNVADGVSVVKTSMDDCDWYGDIVDAVTVTLGKAITTGMVARFEVLGGALIEADIPGGYNESYGGKYTHEDLVKAWFVIDQMKNGESLLSYHGNNAKAKLAVGLYQDVAALMGRTVNVMHVSGASNAHDRKLAVERLCHKDPAAINIVTNCRLFTEGVDINSRTTPPGMDPTLSAVCFFDPRQSTIDIIQSIGRALRRYPGKVAKVIVPVFVPAALEGSAEAFLTTSKYSNLYQVSKAIQMEGLLVADQVNVIRDDSPSPVSVKSPIIDMSIKAPTAWDVADFMARHTETLNIAETTAVEQAILDAILEFEADYGHLPSPTGSDDERALLKAFMNLVPETAVPVAV